MLPFTYEKIILCKAGILFSCINIYLYYQITSLTGFIDFIKNVLPVSISVYIGHVVRPKARFVQHSTL